LAGIGLAVYLTGRSDTASSSPTDDVWQGGSDLLPRQVASLVLTGTYTYDSENLYEYIDGQAPYYVGFGFRGLRVGEYSREGRATPVLVVDVYDMQRRRNAYGLFMDTVPPEEELSELGNAGYLSGNVAVFWKGPFFVRVAALTGEDVGSLVEEVARAIADGIEDNSADLAEFAAFPLEGLIPESFAFIKSAAFGLAYLRETFVAEYEGESGYYRLFFADLEDPRAAVQVLGEHAEFLRSGSGLESTEIGEAEGVVWGQDRYIGPTLMMARGRVVAGSTGLADRASAEAAVGDLLDRAIQVLSKEE
jgi:hypothetical protein